MSELQPIETAPKDGTEILLFDAGARGNRYWQDLPASRDEDDFELISPFYVGYWSAHVARWQLAHYNAFGYDPTHWMPLPAPPATR